MLKPPMVAPVAALDVSGVTNDETISYSRFWRNDMCCAAQDVPKQAKLKYNQLQHSGEHNTSSMSGKKIPDLSGLPYPYLFWLTHQRPTCWDSCTNGQNTKTRDL